METAKQFHNIEETYTLKVIRALPDGKRAELIDGRLYIMSAPGRIHQKLVHFLDWTIGSYIHSKNGDCEIYPAPFAVFLNADDEIYLEPDISVICDRNKLTDEGCTGLDYRNCFAKQPAKRLYKKNVEI